MRKIKYGLIACAAVLVIALGVGAARAVPAARNEEYTAEIATSELTVGLVENGVLIPNEGELLTNTFKENVIPGKNYTEELSAVNTGEVEEYIRVIVTRRWVKVVKNEDGSTTVTEIPETELDPALIRLSLKDTDWIVAPASGNKEQVVLYGKHIVKASETVMFNTEISVDPKVASILTHTELENGSVVSSYDDDAARVQLQLIAEVDAVQVNNAQDAILSAWGVKVNIADDGTLSLAE